MLHRHQLSSERFIFAASAVVTFALSLPHAAAAEVTAAPSQQVVFGFENGGGWTASAGVVTSTSLRSEGNAALALRGFAYSEVLSPALGTLEGVSSRLAIDVRPPMSPGWGQLQVFVSVPSRNRQNAWVGQVALAGLSANAFHEISMPVPPDIEQLLRQSYSDLQVKVVLNVPHSESEWVLDDLHFVGDEGSDCAEGSPYTLAISGQEGVDPGHVERMRCTFYEVYPLLVARFNPAAPTTVGMIFTDEPGVAWASGGNTFYNRGYLASAPLDSDVVVHEIMHVVQGGYSGEVPGWIIEGTADYVRDAYGLHNAEHGWSIPTSWSYGQHYMQGYGDAASFMKWIDANYRRGEAPVADELDDILRQGLYSEQTFVELTGLDVESLWHEYSGGQSPLPAASGVTVFEHSNFGGRPFTLAPGVYDEIDLSARGINNRISSLVVPSGLRVTVYADSFSGASAVYTSDAGFIGELNDVISSIVID